MGGGMARKKDPICSDQENKPRKKPGLPKGRTNNPNGRPKGIIGITREKILQELREAHPDYNPLLAMLECAEKVDKPAERAKIHAEVAQYVLPKLKSVELMNPDGSAVTVTPTVILNIQNPTAQ